MQAVNDINEAIAYLKDGDILTLNGKDLFVRKDNYICRYSDNSHYVLKTEDFMDLYRNEKFYLYEEALDIDELKDEEYYRYYHK